ncbi:MAG: MGMT family protein [Nanoarchaeota archaeon]|nr:MGMT family protein [Nanoarchaeota archaeon]
MNFNQKVLGLVKKIPKGKVTTYKIIAKKLNTKAYRAVGNALHNNKKPVVIPCHRVVNSDGNIGAYSRGIKQKIILLKKEGIEINNNKIVDFKENLFKLK